LKIILGLASPTRGQAKTFRRDTSLVEGREALGFLPENPYFYKFLIGEETLGFFGKLCRLHSPRLDQRVRELLELVQPNECAISTTKHLLERNVATNRSRPGADQPTKLAVLDEPTGRRRSVGSRHICDLIVDLSIR